MTQLLLASGTFVLRGTNGPGNGAFDVLSATNPSTPLGQWSEIASDTFDAAGHFDSTNPLSWSALSVLPPARGLCHRATCSACDHRPTHKSNSPRKLQRYLRGCRIRHSATQLPMVFQYEHRALGRKQFHLYIAQRPNQQPGRLLRHRDQYRRLATSPVAFLTVSNILAPPSITAQPQNQTVLAGQTTIFTVGASGTTPLRYQWYFNTNTPLANATNASLALNNVQTNDAGFYSAIVTNNLGSATSALASLTVNLPSTNNIDFSHVGFGNFGYNVTGAGSNAPSVIVTTADQLAAYSDSNTNVIIYVSGTIPISGMSTHIRGSKTVIGLGPDATLTGGGLYLYRSTNVIIRNLTIVGSSEDDIGLHYSDHVWIDHCTIVDATDGGIDITQGSDYVTLSWCKFYYTVNHGHDFVNLLGASDGESDSQGKLHVTFHHNWWSTNCVERMPSNRFGRVHAYNNYYNAPGNDYCVRTRIDAQCLVENNYFENVNNPWEQYNTSGTPGLLFATNNAFNNVTWTSTYPGTDAVFTPPYSYRSRPSHFHPEYRHQQRRRRQGPFAP